MNGR